MSPENEKAFLEWLDRELELWRNQCVVSDPLSKNREYAQGCRDSLAASKEKFLTLTTPT